VVKLSLDSTSVALYQAYSLSVITPESLLSVKHEANIVVEAILVLRFHTSS
jgi:hypothetical protein